MIIIFGWKDIGTVKLLSQAKHANSGSIVKDPLRWGLESVTAREELELTPDNDAPFPVNVDGSTFIAKKSMTFKRIAKIPHKYNTDLAPENWSSYYVRLGPTNRRQKCRVKFTLRNRLSENSERLKSL